MPTETRLTSLRATISKERLQHFRAASSQYPAANLNLVVHLRMIQHLHHRMNGAGFGIVRPINQALDPGMHQGAGAHGARFNCNKQLALSQTMVTNGSTRFTQRNNLGVRCRIRILDVPIPSLPHDISVAYDDGSNRNFPHFQRSLCTTKGLFHPQFVRPLVLLAIRNGHLRYILEAAIGLAILIDIASRQGRSR